jgi:hypothetical protein
MSDGCRGRVLKSGIYILPECGRLAFKLFKNGDDLHDSGDELIKRGEWSKARDTLQKSVNKDGGDDTLALVKIQLIDISSQLNNASAYRNLAARVRSIRDRGSFEFGINTINCDELITECEVTADKLEALENGSAAQAKAEILQSVAQAMSDRIGSKGFILKRMFANDTTPTGEPEFYNLMALSFEILADAVVWENPQQAAEYQQIAMGYRQQNGQSGDTNMERIRQYSCTSKCWLCGRISTGEGIHFYQTPAEVSEALEKTNDGNIKSNPDSDNVYVCRACYSAVSRRADQVSQVYYNRAMEELRATEARLQAQIIALDARITSVSFRVR